MRPISFLPLLAAWLAVLAAPALADGMHDAHDAHGAHDPGTRQQHMDPSGMHGAAALGGPGEAARVRRTIRIRMDDGMRFQPERIEVKAGETVRLSVRNTGRMPHELVLGSLTELKAHAEMMRKMPTMQHDDPGMLRLAPGRQGSIVWRFGQAGTVDFACLIPGHMEAGMRGTIEVR